ncbi:IS91-like element ISVsa3 family transposase [Salmonella enterica subsp. enterica serovar 1,4,[5],12:i:-]|nr:IS91-like element ISVsa3 family transposase [Salmonella enterica subsp. enterica serovar 1,4,[5],12:i:-]
MPHVAARTASRDRDTGRYQSHRPEQTLLYQIVDEYYPAFAALMAEQGKELPGYVQRKFEEFLQCGRLEHGFLRVRCESCHAEHLVAFSCKRRGFCPSCGARRMAESAALLVDEVLPEQPMRQWVLSFPFQLRFLFASRPEIMGWVLGIVYRVIATHLVKKAGHTHQVAKTGAVTLIQRFGSALNLNVHFHMLFLDGVYVEQSHGSARFRWVKAPTSPELTQLTHTIAHRVGRYLERQGLLERDVENSYLASDAVDDDPMTPLLGHSITYRIAVGSQAGRKVFTLQTLPTSGDPFGDGIGKVAGSSLHAGVAARADERKKLERLCRYISRPAVSEKRLSLTRGGNVRYQLKTPYRDGTTHVIFEPLDFIARLAALVPKPRVNLTRFHGVFAPNSRHRALVTPAKRGRGNKVRVADEPATPAQRRASMTWAQRLKRVFNIDIETCSGCGGAMKVIACIEDPIVIKQILDHLKHKAETSGTRALPESRAPPAELLLGLFD